VEDDVKTVNVGRSVRQLGLPTVVLDSHVDRLLAALAEPDGRALVVTGPSGSGKSALVNKTFRRLRLDGWAVAANLGRWYPRDVFWAVGGALRMAGDDFPYGAESLEAITSGTDNERLDVLCDLLARTPTALAFDDIGQNLDEHGFIDPGFGAVFARLCAAADRGRVIATCRTPLPDGTGAREYRYEPKLEEAVRLAMQLPAMSELEQSQQMTLIALLDGGPRLMGLANTWLNAGGEDLADAFLQLLVAIADARNGTEAGLPDRLRTSLIDLHLRLVTPEWLEVLLQAALSTFPLTTRHLAAACGQELEAVDEASGRLEGLHLVTGVNEGELLVERWIADGLSPHQGAVRDERHERAMQMHNAEMRERRNTYADVVAITRHLVEVRGWKDLTWFTLAAAGPSAGTYAAAALLGEVVPAVPIDNPELPQLVERQITVLRECGLDDAAQRAADRYIERVQRWAQSLLGSEPTTPEVLQAMGIALERIAELIAAGGDVEAAERFSRTSAAAAAAVARLK
jgi:hypothetical protein